MPNHLHTDDHLQDPESCTNCRHCTRDTEPYCMLEGGISFDHNML
jgi:hypothetical protein